MTIFEYMSVASSLIVALTFAQGLRGLRSVLDQKRRYWVHAAWLFIKLANPVIFWWAMWRYHDYPEYWNMATFTVALVVPSLMYLQVYSLIGETSDRVNDWREHFYSQHKWFFGINILLAVLVFVSYLSIFNPAPVLLLPAIAYGIILVLSIAGYVSDNPRLHTFIASFVGGFTFLYYWIITFNPIALPQAG